MILVNFILVIAFMILLSDYVERLNVYIILNVFYIKILNLYI